MSFKLRIIDNKTEKTIEAEEGIRLIDAIRDEKFYIEAPCGGKGKCKKCTVHVDGKGDVLSCMTPISADLIDANTGEITVRIPERGGAVIKSLGLMPDYYLDSMMIVKNVKLSMPEVSDQAPDDRRLASATGASVAMHLLPTLPHILRENDFEVQCLIRQDINEIVHIRSVTSQRPIYGISIDIGTTTLSANLFNLVTGEYVKTTNNLNPQRPYGADVISRIDFASQSTNNLITLQNLILDEIFVLINKLSAGATDVHLLSLAGNTTMMHLLCGHDPAAIAQAPFIPVTIDGKIRYFYELFPEQALRFNFKATCILLPSIAGYVGADITAGILATDLDKSKRSSLLIDIGTNGEIALSSEGSIVCCSTAAGPAFEGANITCGIGGIAGAVDRVIYDNNKLTYTTIAQTSPIGICGSGIISIVAAFIQSGIIDETGRFCDEPEELPTDISSGFVEIDGHMAYVLVFDEHNNPLIYMTQKDIREIQNAKAAVCAGIQLLILRSTLTTETMDDVFIAGGFGNYMNIDDAFTIGLLPSGLQGKVISVGNSSATGATLCMLNQDSFVRCNDIAKMAKYYELSSDKEFTDLYIDAMMFE